MSARYPTIAVALLLSLACGGDSTSPAPPPPPPPPPPSPAASLAIHAGATQSGEPGMPAAVRPAVIVRNAAGAPVANATVTFAVESGGGAVTGGSVTSGADGVATVGGWALGPTEGEQALVATSGALAPVRFVATATVPTRVVASQTISSGTLSITTGSLAGARLVIPAGAFPTGSAWTLEQRSSAGWPTRPGVHPVGATLRISRVGAGLAATPMWLTLPAPVPAGTKPFVLIRDPVSGGLHVLNTVNVENGMITAAAMHFDPSYLVPPAAGSGGFGARLVQATTSTGYDVEVVVSAIPVAELGKDHDSSFRPGVDDWDIAPVASAVEGSATSGSSRMPVGIVFSEMVRYAGGGGGALHNKYRAIPAVMFSNRVGFRAAADIGVWVPSSLGGAVAGIRNASRAGAADQLFFDWLQAALHLTRLPQLVVASVGGGYHALLAYRTVGGGVDLADPWRPGNVSVRVPFSGGQFGSIQVGTGPATLAAADWVGVTALMNWANTGELVGRLKEWEAGRYPVDSRTPTQQQLDASIKFGVRGGFVEDSLIYLTDDTTRVWVECGACTTATPTLLPATGVQPFLGYLDPNGATSLTGLGDAGRLLPAAPANGGVNAGIGFVISQSADGTFDRWLDFRRMRFIKWALDPRPPLSWQFDQPADWTVVVEGVTPPPHDFVWTFGSGAGTVTRVAAAATERVTVTRAQIVGDSVPYTVTMRRLSDGKVLARKEGKVEAPVRTIWRLTSLVLTSGMPDLPHHVRMFQNPARWVLFAFPQASAGTGIWPTPGAYLQENPATGGLVAWLQGVSVFHLAHTVNDPSFHIVGSFTWSGGAQSGGLLGQSTTTSMTACINTGLATVNATKAIGSISGTITYVTRHWNAPLGGCTRAPDQVIPQWTASFTGTLEP